MAQPIWIRAYQQSLKLLKQESIKLKRFLYFFLIELIIDFDAHFLGII